MKHEKLDLQDHLSYEKLENYVKGFRSAISVDREGNVLLDAHREIEIARRYINTKALLDCPLDLDALKLLGNFFGDHCRPPSVLIVHPFLTLYCCLHLKWRPWRNAC